MTKEKTPMRIAFTIFGIILGYYLGSFAGFFGLYALSHLITIGGGMQTTFVATLIGTLAGMVVGGLGFWFALRPPRLSQERQRPKSSRIDIQEEHVWPPQPLVSERDQKVPTEAEPPTV